MAFIAIEGVIGVGKTTLARYLHEALRGTLLLEVFEENPFLSSFYQDRERYAFQTQIFFLLSRYQQLRDLSRLPHPLVSDYMFAKDALFAHLNIAGDELTMYDRVHAALAENILVPDLVVYLRADVDVLMSRIAMRDRPYERGMEVAYISNLRNAYENFFASYDASPVLTIDTNQIDVVQSAQHRAEVINRVVNRLQQPSLPGMGAALVPATPIPPPIPELTQTPRRLSDFQNFHRALDYEKGFPNDVLLNFMLLQEEIGELARAIKQQWLGGGGSVNKHIQEELADVLAYILKIANYTGVDLEAAYLEKMAINQQRVWIRK